MRKQGIYRNWQESVGDAYGKRTFLRHRRGFSCVSAYLIAIDLGTSGPKIALFTLDGRIVASTNREIPLILTPDGGVEQDPDLWWVRIKEGLHEVLAVRPELRSQVVAIGTTGQWAGTIALNEAGRPLKNCIVWMDARGAPAIRRLCRGLPSIDGYSAGKLARWVYKTAGAPALSGKDSIAHIHFIKEAFPEIYRQTALFLEPKDYINFLLTGRIASSLDTMALHWVTNNRNLDNPRYDEKLLALAQLDRGKLPPLQRSIDILGPLSPDLAREFNLPSSTKVVIGSPDLHAAGVGSGAIADYQGHLCIGTSSWLTCHVPFKKTGIAVKMATLPSAIPGRYLVANEQESAAYCLHHFRDVFFKGNLPSFEDLEAEAALSPAGSKHLIFTPWLNGERTPVDDHHLRGGFHNVSLQHRREDFIRAIYEGVAFNSRWLLLAVEGFIKRSLPSLHLIGGGAQSALWCQIFADVLGCEIKQVASPRHANARGAAWLAAAGLGLLDFADMQEKAIFSEVFTPNEEHHRRYKKQFAEFLQIHRNNKAMHHRLQHLT